jgi:hypothetical protein
VASALNFHFCAYPETFIVNPDLPFVFSSFVASIMVKLHLIRIGVFALHGFIFHIHGDRPSAVADVSGKAATPEAGKDSKFENSDAPQALQRPTCAVHLTERGGGVQLDGSESACHQDSILDDSGENGSVKTSLSDSSLNAPPTCDSGCVQIQNIRKKNSYSTFVVIW